MTSGPVPPWNQFAVTATAFVGFMGFTVVMPFMPLYFRDLGITDAGDVAVWSGLSIGITSLVAAACGPLWGRVADRFGNKILVQRSLLSFAGVMFALGYVTEAWHVFALRAAQGLVAGYGPLTIAMAARSASHDRIPEAIGTVQAAQRLGPTFGPLVGGLLAPLVGIRGAFIAAGLVYLVAFALLTALYRETPGNYVPTERREPVRMRTILNLPNMSVLIAVIFGLQLVDRSFPPILPLLLEQRGVSHDSVPIWAGMMLSALALMGALGNRAAAWVLARGGPRSAIVVASVTGAAALSVFAVPAGPLALTIAISVVGLCLGIAMTTAFGAAATAIPRAIHGAGFGVVTSASLVGGAISPVLSGLMGTISLRIAFAAGAVVLVIVAIAGRRLMVECDVVLGKSKLPPIGDAQAVERS